MAKRLTDTEKWKDDWYLSLSNDDKVVWQWLIDNCSHSGICKPSISLINIMCKVNYTQDVLFEKMENRIIDVGKVWFIPKFIKFQYSTLLSNKPAVLSVVKELFEYNLIEMVSELFGKEYTIIEKSFNNHCKMIKDKDKVKDIVKDKDKDKDKDKKTLDGENKILRGVKFSENMDCVVFENGETQKLGKDQIGRLNANDLKPYDVVYGLVN